MKSWRDDPHSTRMPLWQSSSGTDFEDVDEVLRLAFRFINVGSIEIVWAVGIVSHGRLEHGASGVLSCLDTVWQRY